MAKPDKFPYMQFYVSDWIKDTQTLDLRGRGAWITVICQLWLSKTPGERQWTVREFQNLLHLESPEELEEMLSDLATVGEVFTLDENNQDAQSVQTSVLIKIISRRIKRDIEKLNKRKNRNKRHYDKLRRNQDGFKTDRSQKSEVRSQNLKIKNQQKSEPKLSKKLDPRIDEVCTRIYNSDPSRFQRLIIWVKEAQKHNFEDWVIAKALERFEPHAQVVERWYPYLDKIIVKIEGDKNADQSLKEHERQTKETREAAAALAPNLQGILPRA